jgi:hypothetical protein
VSPEPLGRIRPRCPPTKTAQLALTTTLGVMKKAGVA